MEYTAMETAGMVSGISNISKSIQHSSYYNKPCSPSPTPFFHTVGISQPHIPLFLHNTASSLHTICPHTYWQYLSCVYTILPQVCTQYIYHTLPDKNILYTECSLE